MSSVTGPRGLLGSLSDTVRTPLNLPLIGNISLFSILLIGGAVFVLTRRKKQKFAVVSL